jgi:8-oxo-dGTP pyrophosphatase MutT (NUDIX family)
MKLTPLTPLTVRSISLRLASAPFDFAIEHRQAIEDAWQKALIQKPKLFNGRFFLLTRLDDSDGSVTGDMVETNYASYLHYRAMGFPGSAANAFAMPVLHPRDGGVLVGRMAAWTANGGRWYPPAGSLDETDLLADGRFDIEGNVVRELNEELGLLAHELPAFRDWTLISELGRLACFCRFDLPLTGSELLARAEKHLSEEKEPELDAVRIIMDIRETAGLDMPDFVKAYLAATLSEMP